MTNVIKLNGNFGIYKGDSWRREAGLQYRSYLALKKMAMDERFLLRSLIQEELKGHLLEISERDSLAVGYSKSAVLLLSYAIELALKSCAIPLFLEIPKNIALRQIRKFGHDFVKIMSFVEFEVNFEDEECLRYLSKYVRDVGRYPAASDTAQDFANDNAALRRTLFDDAFVEQCENIYGRIIEHSEKVQGVEELPASHTILKIDEKVVVFRESGLASPRLTVYSPYVHTRFTVEEIVSILVSANNSFTKLIADIIQRYAVSKIITVW